MFFICHMNQTNPMGWLPDDCPIVYFLLSISCKPSTFITLVINRKGITFLTIRNFSKIIWSHGFQGFQQWQTASVRNNGHPVARWRPKFLPDDQNQWAGHPTDDLILTDLIKSLFINTRNILTKIRMTYNSNGWPKCVTWSSGGWPIDHHFFLISNAGTIPFVGLPLPSSTLAL